MSGGIEAAGDEAGAKPRALPPGEYVLRGASGDPVCGLDVLGTLPWRIVCGSPWAAEGHESQLGALVSMLRSRARRPACTLLSDLRDPMWERILSPGVAPDLGRWCIQRRLPVAITGVPVNLEQEEQAKLAQLPFRMAWEFLPFHAGRIMWI